MITTAAELSKLLWDARQTIDMYADLVQVRMGKPSQALIEQRDRIDAFRAARGWAPDGFGGEQGVMAIATVAT